MPTTTLEEGSTFAVVQPSAVLIDALHHKLCDPSIVHSFERWQSAHVTQRLITPRWILKSKADAVDLGNGTDFKPSSFSLMSDDGQKTNSNDHSNEQKHNQIPKRNYLDIRIEQNALFADEQCHRCQKKLAALSSSPNYAASNNRKQIDKVIDMIKSHLNEGLAACPNHDGLLKVESDLKLFLDRMNGVEVDEFDDSAAVFCSKTVAALDETESKKSQRLSGNDDTRILIDHFNTTSLTMNNQQMTKRKGAESRVQSAIDDALVEKMFSQGDNTSGSNRNDTNNYGEKWVPPPDSFVDERARQRWREDSSDSNVGSRHKHRRKSRQLSRSRSRSPDRGEDRTNIKGQTNHQHRRDDRKRRRKSYYKSRSRSLSSRSSSSSTSSLSSRLISRKRSKRKHRRDRCRDKRRQRSSRRKEKKKKKKKKKKSSKRHRSSRRRSKSVSSSFSSSSATSVGSIGRRFEPPPLSKSRRRSDEQPAQRLRDDFVQRFVPPSVRASDEMH